jgi:hypothetical protein
MVILMETTMQRVPRVLIDLFKEKGYSTQEGFKECIRLLQQPVADSGSTPTEATLTPQTVVKMEPMKVKVTERFDRLDEEMLQTQSLLEGVLKKLDEPVWRRNLAEHSVQISEKKVEVLLSDLAEEIEKRAYMRIVNQQAPFFTGKITTVPQSKEEKPIVLHHIAFFPHIKKELKEIILKEIDAGLGKDIKESKTPDTDALSLD